MYTICTLFIIFSSITLQVCSADCVIEQNIDYRGIPTPNDLTTQGQSANTYQACCALCNADSRCNAWTYSSSVKLCFLKTQVGYRSASVGRISGLKSQTTNPTSQTCSIEQNMYYRNSGLGLPIQSASYSACCSSCQTTSGCVAWSFYNSLCYLKSGLPSSTDKVSLTNAVSGTKSNTNPNPNPTSQTCSIEQNMYYRNSGLGLPIQSASYSACCSSCQTTAGCVAWSFYNSLCYLKSGLPSSTDKVSLTNAVSGTKSNTNPNPNPTNTFCDISYGYIYSGTSIVTFNLNNPSECCNKCGQTSGCVGWNYYTDRRCELKSTLTTRVVQSNAISGTKRN